MIRTELPYIFLLNHAKRKIYTFTHYFFAFLDFPKKPKSQKTKIFNTKFNEKAEKPKSQKNEKILVPKNAQNGSKSGIFGPLCNIDSFIFVILKKSKMHGFSQVIMTFWNHSCSSPNCQTIWYRRDISLSRTGSSSGHQKCSNHLDNL